MTWRSSVVIGCVLGLAMGCGGGGSDDGGEGASDDALVSSSTAPFDVAALRPRATRTFTTPSGVTELCIVPRHFAEDGFTAKDAKKEDQLCRVDWNAAPGQDGVVAAGLAPKSNSTNPATDIHEVTAAISRDVVESFAEANARDRKAKKLGRLKSSLDAVTFDRTSSYAPSILGYYATSRLLGNIAEITPAVWRTLDVARHAKVADEGRRLTVPGSQIVKTLWASFAALDARAGGRGALTYTSDGAQVYGAFIPSVSGDEKDKDIDTLDKLTASPRFRAVTDARPLAGTIGTDLKSAALAIVPMQGVVEMLVIDALMLQGDRLSGDNVSFVPYVYFQRADGSVDRMTQKELDDLKQSSPADVPANAVPVKKLYLNDVDAGLIVKSPQSFQSGAEFGLLRRVAHMAPDLYTRLRKLAELVAGPDLESFAKAEWRYTDRDWARYKEMVTAVAALVHDRCTTGDLVLDLDVARHVGGTSLAPRDGC